MSKKTYLTLSVSTYSFLKHTFSFTDECHFLSTYLNSTENANPLATNLHAQARKQEAYDIVA